MPLFLTVMDVANLLGISRASAYELVRQENFPKLKIVQGRTIIPRDRLLEWLDEQTRYDELWRLKSFSDLCAGISGGVKTAFFRAHNWHQRRRNFSIARELKKFFRKASNCTWQKQKSSIIIKKIECDGRIIF